jgi:Arc/MetJ-type ribon-helix-helix transcriptional regulator
MTVELTPETERLVREELRTGHFRSAGELVDRAVQVMLEKERRDQSPSGKTRAEAVAHIRELRMGARLPEGVTIKDLITKGRA